jgi:Uracil DNA glycosylase superfamily
VKSCDRERAASRSLLAYRPGVQQLLIYCADIGSVPNARFGWARAEAVDSEVERHRGGTEIIDLVEAVSNELMTGGAVALGFECPLFVPVPEQAVRLGSARAGEGNRPWSAGAGAGALATGVVQVAWILQELRERTTNATVHLAWQHFIGAGRGLFLWEAFVTDRAKATSHVDDATVAVAAFRGSLPDPTAANAVSAHRPLSLLGAALLWSGWTRDLELLRTPCLVIKAAAPAAEAEAKAAATGGRSQVSGAPSDPSVGPRANRDPREVRRKRELLHEPHVAPLGDFVRRLRAKYGEIVPWFDPTEAGTQARILMMFENPGRRADAAHGSGFISADNDDRSAENMWHLLREAGINRRRDMVAWNIVPWYLGDERKIGAVRMSDIDEARPALLELLGLLRKLRVVILFGRKAQAGWRRAQPPLDVAVLEAPHPSGRWLNAHPGDAP